MKGVDKALVDSPIEPLHEGDDRPIVKDLIEKHRKSIDKLVSEINQDPLYDATKHDDLWILRFVLSHKRNHKESLKAIKHTLQFRKERKLDEKDIRYAVPGTPGAECPEMNEQTKHADPDTFLWCLPQAQGHVIAFVRYKGLDQDSLVENVDKSTWVPTFVYIAEWAHQWCDYVTRTTGRLTKNVRLIDFAGMRMMDVNREVGKRDSEAMKVTEDCYPQLLQSVYICHGPTWMQIIWRFFRPILPRRMVEKVDFVNPTSNNKERDRLCKHVPIALLPERFGGNYKHWPVNYGLPGQATK